MTHKQRTPHNTRATDEFRVCSICGCSLPNTTEYFYARSDRKALSHWCRECRSAEGKRHYQENRATIRARVKELWPLYRERDATSHARWAAANPDVLKRGQRRWYEANKHIVRTHGRNRRARVAAAEGSHNPADIKAIAERQRHRCYFCDGPLFSWNTEVDHLIPLSRGGTNWPDNLALTCRSCNAHKRKATPDEFVFRMRRLISTGNLTWLPW